MDSVVPRFAGADESVEQCGALGAAHQAVSAHPGVLLAGGTYRARYPGRSRSRDNSDAERLRGFRDHGCGDSGDSREKIGRGEIAGADVTYSIEAMMGDGKALQAGTSHFPGQNFSQAFDVKYLDQNGQLQFCWTTSWGLSTRVVGAIIMVHGDDQGLVMPPKLAPYQVVIVPIFKTDEEKKAVFDTARTLKVELAKADVRVTLDEREGQSPGWKFNDWEMRGVPLRVELGPKDVAKQSAILGRRDRPGKEGKVSASLTDLPTTISKLLVDIQQSLHA